MTRRYYEAFYRELRLPESIDEFDELAGFFTDSFASERIHRYGVSMSSFGSGSFFKELYYRLMAVGIQGSNKKRDTDRLRKEIERYFHLLRISNIGDAYHISDGAEEFIRGNSMMSIFSTSETRMFNDNKYDHFRDNVASCDVPGGKPVIDSNMIGILEDSSHLEEALAFLRWLFGKSVCNILTALSGEPIIRSSVQNTQVLELYPWLKYYNDNVNRGFFIDEVFYDRLQDTEYKKRLTGALADAFINPTQMENLLQMI